jgi:hypothetical protein
MNPLEIHTFAMVVSGSSIKNGGATLNCLVARQLCFDDASCSAILEIIPRVCGPELGELFLHISTPNPQIMRILPTALFQLK